MCVKEETLPSASWEAPRSPKLFSVTKEGLRFVLDIVGHQQTVHKKWTASGLKHEEMFCFKPH